MHDESHTPSTSNTGATLIGLALGAAVGVGLALLLAPASGKGTRQRLASSARRWRDKAGHAIDQARDTVAELGTDAKSAIQAGHDAFMNDRATRESRLERGMSPASDGLPGPHAVKDPAEDVAR